jgi:hypothetical protein
MNATQIAIFANPKLAPGLLLLIGQLMRELGKHEVSFNPDEFVEKYGSGGGISVGIRENTLIVTREVIEGEE